MKATFSYPICHISADGPIIPYTWDRLHEAETRLREGYAARKQAQYERNYSFAIRMQNAPPKKRITNLIEDDYEIYL